MEQLDPKGVLNFLKHIHELKHLPRRGWVPRHITNCESISGHMYAMAIMTFLLDDNSEIDKNKCLQLALVHDMTEAIVGDITPFDGIAEDEKHRKEDEAMKEITRHIGVVGEKIYSLYQEYAAKATAEAKFVKDLDRFDFLFTGACYEKQYKIIEKIGHDDIFSTFSSETYKHPFIKKLAEALEQARENQYRCSCCGNP